jgi:hypothetical protein
VGETPDVTQTGSEAIASYRWTHSLDYTYRQAYNICMDITEFSRLGGKARALKLPAIRRKQIAIKAANKRWKKNIDTVLEWEYEDANPKGKRCKICKSIQYEKDHNRYSTHKFDPVD